MNKLAISAIIISFLVLIIGCTYRSGVRQDLDETGKRVRIGIVNTDPIFLRSVESRVETVVSHLRAKNSVFYQPTPEYIVALTYVSIFREIRKIGFTQPGTEIDENRFDKILNERAIKEGEIYLSKMRAGESMAQVAAEYKFNEPREHELYQIGENADWDKVLVDAKIGEYTSIAPVKRYEYAYIFKVHERGTMEDGEEWVDMAMFAFPLQIEAIENELKEEIAKTWDVTLFSDYHKAVFEYFSGNVVDGYEVLYRYLSRDGGNDSMANYLMSRILLKKYDSTNDHNLINLAVDYLNNAISHSTNSLLTPHLHCELAKVYIQSGNKNEALNNVKSAIDMVRDDIFILQKLIEMVEGEDDEYYNIAKSKIDFIENQIRLEIISRERSVDRSGKVMTGEGFLHEDNDEIFAEMKEVLNQEKEFDFSNLEVKD